MRFHSSAILGVFLGLLLSACTTTDDTPAKPVSGIGEELDTPVTPTPARLAEQLQEAKQQYDDGQYPMSMKMAIQAQQLIKETKQYEEALPTAVNIHGYCLLQLGYLDDYEVNNFGRQPGASTKFAEALKLAPDSYPNNFRAELGLALTKFRRHGESIRKAESLDHGILALMQIKEDIRRALAGGPDAAQRKREAVRKGTRFVNARESLIKLGYIFRDPTTMPMDGNGHRAEAPWLGGLTQAEEELAIKDVQWLLDDTINGAMVEDIDRKRGLSAADRMADSWRPVRKYWRLASLKDLQGARDDFLRIMKKWPGYFWGERDLSFIYQSLGGFFLDVGLEQARLKAIAAGKHEADVEAEARRLYLAEDFESWEKLESKRNYKVALEFNLKFVQSHRRFEELRIGAREATNYDDMNENPFLVDLVQRYHDTMDEMIAKERNMRASMILEAAALCVDPLFQINDLKQAILLANNIQGLAPNNPIHHFVRATAYYTEKNYQEALACYNAFLKESSIMTDARQRDISRARRSECEQHLRNKPPAGGAGGNG